MNRAAPVTVPGLELPCPADAEPVMIDLADVTLGGCFFRAPPAGRALLIVHGWGEDAATHAPMARFFRDAGFHVLTVSLRGSRGSGGCDDYGLQQPSDLLRVLDWLARRTEGCEPYLYGYSQGGLVALLALAAGAPVRAAATLNAPTDLRGFARDTAFPFITRYLEAVCWDERWEDRSPIIQAGRIRTPTLLLVSELDRHVPPAQGRDMHERLTASTLRVIPGAAHAPDGAQLHRVWREVLGFFGHGG